MALRTGRAAYPFKHRCDFDKCGGVKDPGGNTWWIAAQIN